MISLIPQTKLWVQKEGEHFVLSRFYLHDYLEQTIYRELGLNIEE